MLFRRPILAAVLWLPFASFAAQPVVRIAIYDGPEKVAEILPEGSVAPEVPGESLVMGSERELADAPAISSLPADPAAIADWSRRGSRQPLGTQVFKLEFECADADSADASKTHVCYGARFAMGARPGRGFIQIPAPGDEEFPAELGEIYAGAAGYWFNAAPQWEAQLRSTLAARTAEPGLAPERDRRLEVYDPYRYDTYGNDRYRYDRYRYDRYGGGSSRSGAGNVSSARPVLKPKSR